MELKLKRTEKSDTYTMGKLFINDVYFCDTVEDKDRGLTSSMSEEEIQKIKVKGETAIPTGTYVVTLKIKSPKYSKSITWDAYNGGYMPRLLNVKGFLGILIHSGNTPEQSEGCVLVGKKGTAGSVYNSLNTFKSLYEKLKEASDKGEQITINIE